MIDHEQRWQDTREKILSSGQYPRPLWDKVEAFAETILAQGRPDFDKPHTHAVVYWMYTLVTLHNERAQQGDAQDEYIDIVVALTIAWFHDIGYFDLFDKVATFKEVQDKKTLHMAKGAQMARDFLEEQDSTPLDDDQIDAICYVISIHDTLEAIVSALEKLMVRADTLGMMDVDWVEPTYRGNEALDFPSKPKTQQRFSFFETPEEIEALQAVVEKFERFVIDRDFNGIDPRPSAL